MGFTKGIEMTVGRPTKFKVEGKEIHLSQLRFLGLSGFNYYGVSFIFGVSEESIKALSDENEDVRASLNPTRSQVHQFLNRSNECPKKKRRLEYKRMWQKKKRDDDKSFRIEGSIRARMNAALKGRVKKNSIRDLPYTTEELIKHLESMFEEGMSWDNYGEWHIDHIKPCSMFDHTDREQFLECWSLDNLQPLWKIDNLVKGDRYGSS